MAKSPRVPSLDTPNGSPDYLIGYGKPPTASQFQKGRSGNPSGASRKVRARKVDAISSTFDQIVLKAAGRKIAITDNGVRSEISTHEAVVRRLAISAAKGEPAATRRYLEYVQAAEGRDFKDRMSRFGLLVQYVQEQSVPRQGAATVDSVVAWPSPDDIGLDYVNCRGEVVGPIDAQQAQPFITLVEEYRVWQTRLAHFWTIENCAWGELLALYEATINNVQGLLGSIRHHLPPSFLAQLSEAERETSIDALDIADPSRGAINLATLSPQNADCSYTLHIVSALAANKLSNIRRRAKLDITANTASLINRLQIERQNRDGGAPPIQAAPDFDQFYDDFVVDGLSGVGETDP